MLGDGSTSSEQQDATTSAAARPMPSAIASSVCLRSRERHLPDRHLSQGAGGVQDPHAGVVDPRDAGELVCLRRTTSTASSADFRLLGDPHGEQHDRDHDHRRHRDHDDAEPDPQQPLG